MVTPLRIHHDCCFVTSLQITLKWSHLVILMWMSFGDSIVNHYESCILMSHQITSQWSHMITFRWPTCEDFTVKSSWTLLCDKSKGDISLISLGNSSQNNYYCGSRMKSTKDSYLSVIMRRMKYMKFQFTVTVTLVNITDVNESHIDLLYCTG